MYSSRARAEPSLGQSSMSGSARLLPLPPHHCDENSTKTVATNHVPESISTHARTTGLIHHSPETRTIINNAPTYGVKNTTGNPGLSKASQAYSEYCRQTCIPQQQPTQYSYTPGRGSVAVAPASSHNNAEVKPDQVDRRDYVVIDVRDFGNDMDVNDDSEPTWKSKLSWKGARELFI